MNNYFDISKTNYHIPCISNISCPSLLNSEVVNRASEVAMPLIKSHVFTYNCCAIINSASQLCLDSKELPAEKETYVSVAKISKTILFFIGTFYSLPPATVLAIGISIQLKALKTSAAMENNEYTTDFLNSQVIPALFHELWLTHLLTGWMMPIVILLTGLTVKSSYKAYQVGFSSSNDLQGNVMNFLRCVSTISSGYRLNKIVKSVILNNA